MTDKLFWKKVKQAKAVDTSKNVAGISSSSQMSYILGSNSSTSNSVIGSEFVCIRSRRDAICGETNNPRLYPASSNILATFNATADHFPFIPAI